MDFSAVVFISTLFVLFAGRIYLNRVSMQVVAELPKDVQLRLKAAHRGVAME